MTLRMAKNDKKSQQLGMTYGKALYDLKKELLFDFSKRLKLNKCFQCGKKIASSKEMSVEHKVPFLDSKNPIKLFFDLKNIAFSHCSCNYSAGRRYNKIISPKGKKWCWNCRKHKPIESFPANSAIRKKSCTHCDTIYKRRYRK